MEINIIKEIENPLFGRKEVVLSIDAKITPSMIEARNIIADKYSVSEDLVRVREVKGKFGSNTFSIVGDIYVSLDEFKRIVKKTKQELKAEEEVRKVAFEAKKAEAEARKAEEEVKNAEVESVEEVKIE